MQLMEKTQRKTRPSHQQIASMRGNLRQIMDVPEESRTEAQRKAVIKITGTLNHIRHEQIEKTRLATERIRTLESQPLIFERESVTLMVLHALASLAKGGDRVFGTAISGLSGNNPFMSSAAFDQLEGMGYLTRVEGGDLVLTPAALAFLKGGKRRRTRV